MIAIPLAKLINEVQTDGVDHLAGRIKSPETLFTPETMRKLSTAHPGVFSYLAFNERADRPIVEYLAEGTLGDDSASVLCLFCGGTTEEGGAEALTEILDLDRSTSYASQILDKLFAPAPAPPLPGIVFFAVLDDDHPVYVPLDKSASSSEVRTTLRNLFSIAENVDHDIRASGRSRTLFCESLAVELQKRRLAHVSAGRKSIREWLTQASQVAWDNRGDIFTAVGFAL